MSFMRTKSDVDLFWDTRAIHEKEKDHVNIADLAQRQLENDFIFQHLPKSVEILEIGCGNGFLTTSLRKQAAFVDAFDYSENMIHTAKSLRGETNNKFYHDDLLYPVYIQKQYDYVICVRVLINLKNLDEQKQAITNIKSWLKPQGKLILIEGFADGFCEINSVRAQSGLKALQPAAINFYSAKTELMSELESNFDILHSMHSGAFDYLTRVVYPAIVGEDNATGYSEFHKKILPLVRSFNPDCMKHLARLHGFLLKLR